MITDMGIFRTLPYDLYGQSLDSLEFYRVPIISDYDALQDRHIPLVHPQADENGCASIGLFYVVEMITAYQGPDQQLFYFTFNGGNYFLPPPACLAISQSLIFNAYINDFVTKKDAFIHVYKDGEPRDIDSLLLTVI